MMKNLTRYLIAAILVLFIYGCGGGSFVKEYYLPKKITQTRSDSSVITAQFHRDSNGRLYWQIITEGADKIEYKIRHDSKNRPIEQRIYSNGALISFEKYRYYHTDNLIDYILSHNNDTDQLIPGNGTGKMSSYVYANRKVMMVKYDNDNDGTYDESEIFEYHNQSFKIIDGSVTTEYKFDIKGKIIKTIETSTAGTKVTTYTYNSKGDVVKKVVNNTDATTDIFDYILTYNQKGYIKKIIHKKNGVEIGKMDIEWAKYSTIPKELYGRYFNPKVTKNRPYSTIYR